MVTLQAEGEEDLKMDKERQTKDDGRYIIFCTFPNEEEEEN